MNLSASLNLAQEAVLRSLHLDVFAEILLEKGLAGRLPQHPEHEQELVLPCSPASLAGTVPSLRWYCLAIGQMSNDVE